MKKLIECKNCKDLSRVTLADNKLTEDMKSMVEKMSQMEKTMSERIFQLETSVTDLLNKNETI